MSLVNSIGLAFVEAAEQAGVDPITFIQNMTSLSGEKPVSVEKAAEKAAGAEKVSKRKYNRVVPEGNLRELEVGTFGTDSLGRIHQVVEHRAFADKTRKAWKLAAEQNPVERAIPACEEPDCPVDAPVVATIPAIQVESDAETTDGESDSKPRRAYNRVVPDLALSDVEEGEIQEDALGRSHVATRVNVRGGGTRLTWKFFRPATEKRGSVVSFAEPVESEIHDAPVVKTERVRKPYTSMKPESSAKSLEVGTEAEGKDGETWIVKSFTGAKGTRHAWVRKSSSAKDETKPNNKSKTTTTEINIDTSKGITADAVAAILRQLNVA